jgi:Tfp pilus assembly major pilin PilA
MIAVAVIGILAAVALPQYHGYSVRAKVSECLNLSAAPKLIVSEAHASGSSVDFEFAPTRFCDSIQIAADGSIVMHTRDTGASTQPVLQLVPIVTAGNKGQLQWECQLVAGRAEHVTASCRNEGTLADTSGGPGMALAIGGDTSGTSSSNGSSGSNSSGGSSAGGSPGGASTGGGGSASGGSSSGGDAADGTSSGGNASGDNSSGGSSAGGSAGGNSPGNSQDGSSQDGGASGGNSSDGSSSGGGASSGSSSGGNSSAGNSSGGGASGGNSSGGSSSGGSSYGGLEEPDEADDEEEEECPYRLGNGRPHPVLCRN